MKKIIYLCVVFFLLMSTATFAQASFTDIWNGFWAEEEIQYLHEQEVIKGYDNGSFQPNKPVTRAQAAIMIVNALQLDTQNRPNSPFKDIREDYHAYHYIATVADEGIIRGKDGQFLPNAPLTRGQMAAIIDRAFSLEQAITRMNFKDIDSDHTFFTNIQTIAHHRIATGYEEDRTFRPNQPTTRAQFSVFLARVLEDRFKPVAKDVPDLDYFKELILEAESAVEIAMYEKWEDEFYHDQPLPPFSTIEPLFETYYTEEMIDSVWKSFYEEDLDSWGPALAQAFHFSLMEDLTLHVLGQNDVVITGTEPANELNSGEAYFEYSLVRTDSNWLIDDISGNY